MDGLERKGKKMKPFEKCPVCGGDLEDRQVEKILRGAGNTVSMRVTADVCLHCGERLYSEDIVKAFEAIRGKLSKHEFSHFRSLGQSFTVDEDWPNKAIQPTCLQGRLRTSLTTMQSEQRRMGDASSTGRMAD